MYEISDLEELTSNYILSLIGPNNFSNKSWNDKITALKEILVDCIYSKLDDKNDKNTNTMEDKSESSVNLDFSKISNLNVSNQNVIITNNKFEMIIQKLDIIVIPFGSFPLKIYLPESDVDLTILLKDKETQRIFTDYTSDFLI